MPHAARLHSPPAALFASLQREQEQDLEDEAQALNSKELEKSPDDDVMALWCSDAEAFVAVAKTDMVSPAFDNAGIETARAAADAALAKAAEAEKSAASAWQVNPDGGPLEPTKLKGKTYHFRVGLSSKCFKVTIGGGRQQRSTEASAYMYELNEMYGCDDEAEKRMKNVGDGTIKLGTYSSGESTDMEMHFTEGSNRAPAG